MSSLPAKRNLFFIPRTVGSYRSWPKPVHSGQLGFASEILINFEGLGIVAWGYSRVEVLVSLRHRYFHVIFRIRTHTTLGLLQKRCW